jgi:acyl carrier protein
MNSQERIKALILDCIREHADQSGATIQVDDRTPLIGPGAPLDSIGLVMVVTDLESRVNQAFDAQIVLASERAMSMNHSPFRSVEALAAYAGELLQEAGKGA